MKDAAKAVRAAAKAARNAPLPTVQLTDIAASEANYEVDDPFPNMRNPMAIYIKESVIGREQQTRIKNVVTEDTVLCPLDLTTEELSQGVREFYITGMVHVDSVLKEGILKAGLGNPRKSGQPGKGTPPPGTAHPDDTIEFEAGKWMWAGVLKDYDGNREELCWYVTEDRDPESGHRHIYRVDHNLIYFKAFYRRTIPKGGITGFYNTIRDQGVKPILRLQEDGTQAPVPLGKPSKKQPVTNEEKKLIKLTLEMEMMRANLKGKMPKTIQAESKDYEFIYTFTGSRPGKFIKRHADQLAAHNTNTWPKNYPLSPEDLLKAQHSLENDTHQLLIAELELFLMQIGLSIKHELLADPLFIVSQKVMDRLVGQAVEMVNRWHFRPGKISSPFAQMKGPSENEYIGIIKAEVGAMDAGFALVDQKLKEFDEELLSDSAVLTSTPRQLIDAYEKADKGAKAIIIDRMFSMVKGQMGELIKNEVLFFFRMIRDSKVEFLEGLAKESEVRVHQFSEIDDS